MAPSQFPSKSILTSKVIQHEETEETDFFPVASFVQHRRFFRSHCLRLMHPPWYRNSLLASTGYLEFANAGDFAANVWNDIPVPLHAKILMAIGGPLALMMSMVAVRDGLLSWQNVRVLRAERKYLKTLRHHYLTSDSTVDVDLVSLIDSRLGVGFRELGTELIDRIAMDIFLGVGALVVGIGTLMAIWGANPRVFNASNLLSGFVGNSFAAAYGVVNAVWSVYLVWRFQRHVSGVTRCPTVDSFRDRLRLRFRRFQWHSIISAITGLVVGAASMVTARMWWGYVVLIPCMVVQIGCNRFWRRRLGYDRPLVSPTNDHHFAPPNFNKESGDIRDDEKHSLFDSLSSTVALYDALEPLPSNDLNCTSLDALLQFVVSNDLFDSLCAWLAHDQSVSPRLHKAIFCPLPEHTEISITPRHLLHLPGSEQTTLHDLCRGFLETEGRKVLLSRERYLLELVGYSLQWDSPG
ncbi:hypothetical protein EYZ11_004437 [Aspergillus tanneri]|uniref:Integral membrane protein n=1 Tax=Aspergillus tanneri TaxID=1220188 RepID=A0A4V3UPW7_9EURO|nr:uncharacterized protein ATNIH1004_002914 [Aspergillus tanneri]KAA8650233.1 hypothetical protein ATNIH1004_002914 [Aspergillus tanneri]THC96064.1 hypothetical protein EYZ11_004437 [Aspergillus tanneri]